MTCHACKGKTNYLEIQNPYPPHEFIQTKIKIGCASCGRNQPRIPLTKSKYEMQQEADAAFEHEQMYGRQIDRLTELRR